ncbi:MAG: hemerythrin domain-containing protein [Deltaproteobacteria bacterium]|nr:hemerythrin domain-containing protein [Deltaproteobacteria bacterium]
MGVFIKPSDPVGLIAARVPSAVRVLEEARIDYHGSGSRSLRDACSAASAPLERIMALVEEQRATESFDWSAAPLSDLIAHIVDGHHVFTRELLRRIESNLAHALRQHADRLHLIDLEVTFRAFSEDLLSHLDMEETSLFPHILGLAHRGDLSELPYSSVDFPVRVMNIEHESAEDHLGELRRLGDNFVPPPRASGALRALYADLCALERDIHEHIHLENNVLFPRALEMERTLLGPDAPPSRTSAIPASIRISEPPPPRR